MLRRPFRGVVALLLALAATGALAQEAQIRKALAERLPQLKIDEVSRSPIAGLYEVRFAGSEILYSDANGDYLFVNGSLLDTKTRTDLTEQRQAQLSAIDFAKLPAGDAITLRQGNGQRRVAVFADPNCGFCKRFERDLATLKDVTILTYVIPILGPDSQTKSRDIWCAKDRAKAWRDWMIDGVAPPKAAAGCDAQALERNLEFARAHRVNSTPVSVFPDGTRLVGALPLASVERALAGGAARR